MTAGTRDVAPSAAEGVSKMMLKDAEKQVRGVGSRLGMMTRRIGPPPTLHSFGPEETTGWTDKATQLTHTHHRPSRNSGPPTRRQTSY